MLSNLIKVIDERFLTRNEAADALFPGKKAKGSNLSTLLSSDPTTKFRRPTIEALKRIFPEYNINWLLHDIDPPYAKDQPIQAEPNNINIEQDDLMTRINDLTERIIELKEDKKMLRKDKEDQAKYISELKAEIEILRSQLGSTNHLSDERTA